jgi:hypothetical protein
VEATVIIQSIATTQVVIALYLAVARYSDPFTYTTYHESVCIAETTGVCMYTVGILVTAVPLHRIAEWILAEVPFEGGEIKRVSEEREKKDGEKGSACGQHVKG